MPDSRKNRDQRRGESARLQARGLKAQIAPVDKTDNAGG